ncbi:MAG: DinB family protein [Marmoricola sp.]
MDASEPKDTLHRYLQMSREALLWKLEGLSERDLRLPRTPTGMNLLGLVKHMANVEVGYFGDTFGRPWPTPGEQIPAATYDTDPQADWFATESETAAGIIDFYRRVWVFADETITTLPFDAPGKVPWWGDRGDTTLGTILVHVATELARHAGHADIVRELIDGAAGLRAERDNLPPDEDWPAYVEKLTTLAERF